MSKIELIKSTFYNENQTKQALAYFVVNSKRLSMGEECKKFEENFAAWQGRKHAVFVSNGSMANLVLIQSLKNLNLLKTKVGVSALTWSTNVMPLMQLGMVPVPIDVEIGTLNVSPNTLRERIDGIDALFLTNALGFCDDIQEIANMCAEKGIPLIEDNCESLASVKNGRKLGNFGLASTFSFFVGHHLSTIEGGMICTDDENLYDMLLMVRAHGWDRSLSATKKHALRYLHNIDEFYGKYAFYYPAFNARPTEVQGFLGHYQLQFIDEIVKKREYNFNTFYEATKRNTEIIPLDLSMDVVSNFGMPLVFKTKEIAEATKERFNNIEIRPIISGDITRQPFMSQVKCDPCPNARFVHENGFYFGNNPDMTKKEIKFIEERII